MKIINKIIVSIIMILLLLTSFTMVKAEDASYSGSRNVVIQMDESDMNSYVSGGREGLEYVIRKSKPMWLDYNLKTKDKTITLTMQFTFENYEQYIERLTELLGYEPAILNEGENTKNIIEGFNAIELTNFIKNELESEGMLVEGNIQDFFTVVNSTLQIGENTYETKDSIDTREKQDIILFSNVSITTDIENISSYSRTIEVVLALDNKADIKLDSDGDDDIETVKNRFEKVGELGDSRSNNRLSVTFQASNLEEISEKTMQALNVSALITEKKEYKSDDRIKVTYEERIDTEKLLSENGNISYRITCPEIYENIEKTEKESAVSVYNQTVTLRNKDENMAFTYERPLTIENIKIRTNITMYGEIERNIILQIPLEYATYYKDILTEKIKGKLDKGMTLNIYDEGIMRCYSIEFKALTLDRLEEKTSQVISGKDRVNFENKYIFFLKSSIKENLEVNTIIDGILQPSQVELEYILPNSTNKIQDEKVDNHVYTITTTDGKVEFTFTYNNYIVLGLIAFGILVIVIIIFIIVRKIKNKSKKDITRPEEKLKNDDVVNENKKNDKKADKKKAKKEKKNKKEDATQKEEKVKEKNNKKDTNTTNKEEKTKVETKKEEPKESKQEENKKEKSE